MDGGVEGGVVVDGVALWGAVDLGWAVRIGLDADADEGTAEPCSLRLSIGIGNESYCCLGLDMVDVAMPVDSIERERFRAKCTLETACEHKVFGHADFDTLRCHKPYFVSHLERKVEFVSRKDKRLASRDG